MNEFIPYGRQSINEEDIKRVIDVLKSDWLTQGPCVTQFESALQYYTGAKYAYAVCNATAALHLSYLALELGKGDILWTSPNTFLSTANAALMCGAVVDFVDICPKTFNLSVEALEEKLIQAKKINKLPKIVVPVHFAGQSCDMKKIFELSKEYGFKIVEDAAHAIGGRYLKQPVGSCQYSDITIFSFHPVKIITTGEGGVVMANSKMLADKIALLRAHGMTRDQEMMTKIAEGDWYYQMLELGYNYRITDIQCALGMSQLKRIDEFVANRHIARQSYERLLSHIEEINLPYQSKDSYSALHLYPIEVPEVHRKKLFAYLRINKIGVNVHYIPVYMQPYYEKLGFKGGCCPNAEAYYNRAISLPIYPTLSTRQIHCISERVMEGLE